MGCILLPGSGLGATGGLAPSCPVSSVEPRFAGSKPLLDLRMGVRTGRLRPAYAGNDEQRPSC